MKSAGSRIFLFLFILLLPSQLARHYWPAASLISAIPVDYLSPTFFLTDILSIIIVCIFLPKIRIWNVYLFVCTFILLNSLFSLSPALSFYKWIRLLFYLITGLSLQIAIPKFPKTAILGLAGSVLWVSLLAWGQFLHGSSLGSFWWYLGERPLSATMPLVAKVKVFSRVYLRPYATFPHPNALAGYLLLSCLLIYFNIKKYWDLENGIWKLFVICGLCIGIFTLFLTFSRPAILLEIIFILYLINQKFHLPKALNLLVIILLTLTLTLTLTKPSVSERVHLINKSLALISSHPLTGVGLGSFPVYPYPFDHFPLQLSWQPVHNIFLLLLAELGIPTVLVITYFVIKYCLIIKKANIIFLYSVICILFTGLFDHYWLTSHQNLLLLVLTPAMVKFHPQ